MNDGYSNIEVLITVMTYPHPSQGHQELVCTAGIDRNGNWVRLYPVDYRYRPKHQQFQKYQWISVDVLPTGASNDHRKESRKPNLESIKLIGDRLGTKTAWRDRRAIVDNLRHYTLNELIDQYSQDRTFLGVVRPSKVLDLEIVPDSDHWKPEWQKLFDQMRLFGEPQKPLRKIPYKFSYVFECEDSIKPHNAMIEDWELGVLFLKESDRLGSDKAAAQSVKEKYLGELCRPDKETRFYMGTVFPFNSWIVLGVFWPPCLDSPRSEQTQISLPFD